MISLYHITAHTVYPRRTPWTESTPPGRKKAARALVLAAESHWSDRGPIWFATWQFQHFCCPQSCDLSRLGEYLGTSTGTVLQYSNQIDGDDVIRNVAM
jgi:hypothetical protein